MKIKILQRKDFAAYEYPRVVEFNQRTSKKALQVRFYWRVFAGQEFVGKRS